MIRKLIVSILASGSICLLPALGRRETFEHLHLWILFAVGIAAGLFQPSYNPFQGDASDSTLRDDRSGLLPLSRIVSLGYCRGGRPWRTLIRSAAAILGLSYAWPVLHLACRRTE